MKTHKPKTIKEAIDDFQQFLECDMPSMVFPEEKVLGKDWKRVDSFKSREEVIEYLGIHFKILEKQINEIKRRKKNK